MNFKTYFDALFRCFYSRQNTAEVAALALPSGQVVSTHTVTSSQIDQGVIAPCNGYATLYSDTGSATSIVLASGGVRQTTSFTVAGQSAWLGLQVPVRKGENVAVRSYPTTATIQFISLFGGGANRALYFLRSWGGALWLRLKTSSSLSERAWPDWWRLIRLQRFRSFQSRLGTFFSQLSHHAMGGLAFTQINPHPSRYFSISALTPFGRGLRFGIVVPYHLVRSSSLFAKVRELITSQMGWPSRTTFICPFTKTLRDAPFVEEVTYGLA